MNHPPTYFFCGIGGSGMLPLALIVKAHGAQVAGSDRSLDQGRLASKFAFLAERGIGLHKQDGAGVTSADQIVVASAAVEDTVPDIQAAKRVGARIMLRAELLASLFNAASIGVAVGGTSGKSTTTGMIGWILHQAGKDPTVMNGAVMKNFATPDAPFASALVGQGPAFVAEVDESDGSIARYQPHVAVLNNVALDHKSMAELRLLFGDFLAKAKVAIVNRDNEEAFALLGARGLSRALTFSLYDDRATIFARDIQLAPDGVSFVAVHRELAAEVRVRLNTPGEHNVANALGAMLAAQACGVSLQQSGAALAHFSGIRRRLEVVGTRRDITVIDDFAHNPDKIAATLKTLHAFPGRVLVMFQPHGYGPLKLMRDPLIETFVRGLNDDDMLLMPEPVYYGGTTDKSMSSMIITAGVEAGGKIAHAFPDRAACGDALIAAAKPGDRIVIMGARDDTLSEFAREILAKVGG
jgi:UDP-N-acetylmuramate--alanine ligase